jgi:hypothetical protein
MSPRKEPMRVNEETTAMQLVAYLNELEEEFEHGGRIVAIPEPALTQLKREFFEIRDLVKGRMLLSSEWHKLFIFIDDVGKMLYHFEAVGGELPDELPPESEP